MKTNVTVLNTNARTARTATRTARRAPSPFLFHAAPRPKGLLMDTLTCRHALPASASALALADNLPRAIALHLIGAFPRHAWAFTKMM